MRLVRSIAKIALAAGLLLASHAAAQTSPATEADHRRMLDKLGVKTLRPGVDGWNKAAPNAVNYDEAKAGPFSLLPDPLVLHSGRPVTTPEQWWKVRRPELVQIFEGEVHGRAPARTPAVTWSLVSETRATRRFI